MPRYLLEFILHIQNITVDEIKNYILDFGDNLEITQLGQDTINTGKNFKININTEDPTIIFDTCAQFGRIKSVKISEVQTYGT